MFILSIVPIPLTGAGDANPSNRLAEIRSKIAVAEQRVRDLEAALTTMILDEAPFDTLPDKDDNGDGNIDGGDISFGYNPISNLPPGGENDANVIRQELYRARAFEGELRTAENFWNEIVSSNKSAEQKTHELFKSAG